MPPQTFLLLGRSGCGKGTQSKLLEEYLRKDNANRPVYYFEVGDHVRSFLKGGSYSSKLAKEANIRGDRQPSFVAIWIWSGAFIKDLTGEEHLLVDGACRSITEAEAFDAALNFYKRKANIIFLDISRESAQKRLLARGRSDDADAEKISKRLDWFDRDVPPVVEYFRNNSNHNFMDIDGEKTIPEVFSSIIEKIKVFG